MVGIIPRGNMKELISRRMSYGLNASRQTSRF